MLRELECCDRDLVKQQTAAPAKQLLFPESKKEQPGGTCTGKMRMKLLNVLFLIKIIVAYNNNAVK